MSQPEIVKNFGRVEVDLVKSYNEVDKILPLPNLKEIRLVIRRPNSDDIGSSLAQIIEQRLREKNGDEYEELIRSKDSGSLHPNERTCRLATVAAENGLVKAKSIVNGVLTEQDTSDTPLTEVTTYEADQSELAVFLNLVSNLFDRIISTREQLRG